MAFPSFFTSQDFYYASGFLVEGKAVDAYTRNPVSNIHVYTVAGEEEAFTHKDGSFRMKTWRTFPLTIVAEHPDYYPKKIVVADSLTKPEIILLHR